MSFSPSLAPEEYDAYKGLLRALHAAREGFATPLSPLTAADAISTLLAAECVRAGLGAQHTLDLLAPLREALIVALATKEQLP
jgi:hypothetical protein